MIDSTGRNERRLTRGRHDQEPAWSPDGQWILFVRDYATARGGIFRVRPDGSDLKRVVARPEPLRPHVPTWSPDATRIAWVQWNIKRQALDDAVWVADADGSNRRRIAAFDNMRSSLSWSPDGTMLAVGPGPGGRGTYLVGVETGESRMLREDASRAAWNAEGSKLYYWLQVGAPGDERYELVVRDMRSGREETIDEAGAAWFLYSGFDVEPLPCVRP